MQPGPELEEAMTVVAEAARAAGRDPGAIAMEGRINLKDSDQAAEGVAAWREAGATHLSINTMGAGRAGVADHISALAAAAEAVRR
ncbi:MAG TPA: hypothetical protein VG186_11435 [Solirubrobacteraceae bacterium]|nr:hypothetical protein [Solirubrobacteraceae bacterium]